MEQNLEIDTELIAPCSAKYQVSTWACRVTELEAQRLEETREDRDAFRRMLREEIERQAKEKNIEIKLPPD